VPVNAHVRHESNHASAVAGHIQREGLRTTDRESDVGVYGEPAAVVTFDLKNRWLELHLRLARGHVVARERVVGPPRQQQDRPTGILWSGAQIKGQGMGRRVAAKREQLKVVYVVSVKSREAIQHVVAVLVMGRQRRTRRTRRVEAEWAKLVAQALVWKSFDQSRGCHDQQLELVQEQSLLELVRHPELETSTLRTQLSIRDPDVLDRMRSVSLVQTLPRPHLPAAQEIGHELEAASIPRKEEGARGRLPIQLDKSELAGFTRWGPGRRFSLH